jgi:coatomer subunit alpha
MLQIDATEFLFKQALAARNYEAVRRLIKSGKLCGQAIISFLRKKGFPEVALLFVEDDRERFEIALECGNIEVALATAQRLGDSGILGRLGAEAFRQGNMEIAEKCAQQTKSFERLSFLYAVTGSTDKLGKMLKLAEMRGDIMSRYSNALYMGSARARVNVLEDAGHLALAYVAAKTHGLEEDAVRLAEALGGKVPDVSSTAELMIPPTPILRQGNWPLLQVTASVFESKLVADGVTAAGEREKAGIAGVEAEDGDLDIGGAWGEDDLGLPGEHGADKLGGGADDEDGGWEMEVCRSVQTCVGYKRRQQITLFNIYWFYQPLRQD